MGPGAHPRRQLTVTVLLCLAGAVLVLLAVGRTWVVELTPRTAPLPDLRLERSGGGLIRWLPALGWAGLAGAGALLATRGPARRVLGAVLVIVGLGIAAGAGLGSAGADVLAWPVLAGVGGLLLAVAGGWTVARSGRWPGLGGRYERGARVGPPEPGTDRLAPHELWQALDRGEDPTAR